MATLDLRNVTVVKGEQRVLSDVTLSLNDGELVAVLGPSGSGKTTLLRAVAGLDSLEEGTVSIGGRSLAGVATAQRNLAMVFQSNVLFPTRDVGRNISFPLEMQRTPKADIERRVLAEGRALRITELLDRDPRELSAGHQQLVQIAKAMVRSPDVFLMDEPLARLDARLRVRMRGELLTVQRGYGVTTLYVTNDPVEAMSMGDRIVVVVEGSVVQIAPPSELYVAPASQIVGELTGDLNALVVRLAADDQAYWLEHDAFRIRLWTPALANYVGLNVVLGLRPEHLVADADGEIESHVTHVAHYGPYVVLTCRIGADLISVRSHDFTTAPGDALRLALRGGHVFDPVDGMAVATFSPPSSRPS